VKITKMVPCVVDIGPLDHTRRLPMARRLSRGLRTVCDVCREHITDEYFVAGFKAGHPNLTMHESCAPAPSSKESE
jgi:hypothetical protein